MRTGQILINQGGEEVKPERNGGGLLQRQCVHSASKGNDTDTVSKEGHRVDHKSRTFSICFIRLC